MARVFDFFLEETALFPIDCEPKFEPVKDTPYERAVNTPFLVAKARSGELFLSSGVHWYTADEPLGPWSVTQSPPADLKKMVAEAAGESMSTLVAGTPPQIVVATQPTELIATDGKPDWQSLSGGDILYVQNTETPCL